MTIAWLTRLLLLFWAIYFAIVATTNATDLATGLGLVPNLWWVSGNLKAVADAVRPYGLVFFAPVLLGGVIVWEITAAALFVWALVSGSRRARVTAVTVGVALFLVFILLDELLLLFEAGFEATHFRIAIALLVTLLVTELVPD